MDQFAAIITIKLIRQKPAEGQPGQFVNASVTTIESSAIGPTQEAAVTAAAAQDVAEFIEKLSEKRLITPVSPLPFVKN